MRKFLLMGLALCLVVTQSVPISVFSVEEKKPKINSLADKKPSMPNKPIQNFSPEKQELTRNALNFPNDSKSALKWSNRNFPNIPTTLKKSSDVQHISDANKLLRTKYLNRSELYKPYADIELWDRSFITATTENLILYANFTAEDFGINSKYFRKNAEKVFKSILEESPFGVDHGYFLGSLTKQPLDASKNEVIQVKLVVPKGTKVTRIGNITASQFILPREQTFRYGEKKLRKENNTPYVEMSAELVNKSVLEGATKHQQEAIEDHLENQFGIAPGFLTLVPLGLNAGYVLTQSLEVILKAFSSLGSGDILSKNLFNKEKVIFSNGFLVHSDIFTKQSEGLTLEQKQKLFEKRYVPESVGATQIWPNNSCESLVSFSHLDIGDPLPQNSATDNLASTLLHEFFHYFIASTHSFANKPMFQNNPNLFKDMAKLYKNQEESALVRLLNDDYAEQDWEEFICEAFMAKFHPQEAIKNQFKRGIVQTNRFLDNLFDSAPPSVPQNLEALKVEGNSVKLTFDHARDNVGVEKYNIYQDGKLIKTVQAAKSDNYLSYPNPGEYQKKIEVDIQNLNQVTNYTFQVSAVDEAQNESSKGNALKVKTKDVEAPKLNGAFSGQALGSTAARLNWTKPTDNVGVKEVKIYRKEKPAYFRTSRLNSLSSEEKVFVVPGHINYFTDFTIEKGKAYIYTMKALDEAGNESTESNNVTIKTSEKDDDKKNEDRAENTTSSNTTLNWAGAFNGISPSGFQIFSWHQGGAGWIFDGVSSVAGTATSTIVNLLPALPHQFVIIPVDKEGNPLAAGLPISVSGIVDKSSIKTKDSTLYVGQSWNKEANFVSATDENGEPVPYGDQRITTNGASVDTGKPGIHELTYSFKGVYKKTDSNFKVTVKKDQTTLQLKNITIQANERFDLDAPFDKVTDKDGRKLKAKDIEWYYINGKKSKTLNTSNPGKYTVEISYQNAAGKWLYSGKKTITILDLEAPKLVGVFSGKVLGSTAVRFHWSYPTDNTGIKVIKIYRREMEGSSVKEEMEFKVPYTDNYTTDYVLKGRTYVYTMVALDKGGNESLPSNEVVIKTSEEDDYNITNTTSSKVRLKWDETFNGISPHGFQIFTWRRERLNWRFESVKSVVWPTTSIIVDLIPGTISQFTIIPVDSKGNPVAEDQSIRVRGKA